MNFSASKQFVKPPQRGIFPLDHEAECKPYMEKYLECLKEERNKHHKCRDLSKEYLQCRMDRQLMANEDLDKMGFSKEAEVKNAEEYDKSKEREGYVAGKHIDKPMKWWFQRS
uniref:CHCH domain-containing protein n=1 Tax=Pseudictyota dubia TaxID=2749911 RepID=A0A7R9VJK0_9STRA|mmetsp:Transcript_14801/g.28398  ORF Transcript_14801/g.28398 Transcript_14801/m.28398 type:complete len:113 (+) Transcript_14801:472-810(+)